MSRRRSISTGISLDRLINQLAREAGDFAALLYTWMIPHAEDAACITGDVEELALTVCPGFRHKTEAEIELALEAMDRIGLVAWDREACTIYFDSESFYRHQSYIPTAKRVDNSAHFHERRKKATNAEKKPRTPKNAASLSLSLSPSLSLTKNMSTKEAVDASFERFWTAYPRAEAKKTARQKWARLKSEECESAIEAALQMAECVRKGWQEKTYCPMPTTFINQRRWEDWREGPPVGYLPTHSDTGNLSDVLVAASKTFNLGENRGLNRAGQPDAGAIAGDSDAGGSVPPRQLETG